jgi:hypothetical protein
VLVLGLLELTEKIPSKCCGGDFSTFSKICFCRSVGLVPNPKDPALSKVSLHVKILSRI